MRKVALISVIALFMVMVMCGCRGEDVFGDYSLTYSYQSDYSVNLNSLLESEACADTEESAPSFSSALKSESTVSSTPLKVKPKKAKKVKVVKSVLKVTPGRKAQLKFRGERNKKYTIRVVYSSGPSASKSLKPCKANKNGKFGWEWIVGAQTKPGKYSVTVKQGKVKVYKAKLKVVKKLN